MAKVELANPADEVTHSSAPVAVVRRRRWWPKLAMLLLIVVAGMPSGLSIFGQIPVLLQKLHPSLAKVVQFRTIQLHWWAPIELQGLIVADSTNLSPEEVQTPISADTRGATPGEAGEPADAVLLCVERVTTVEPLWKIVLQRGQGVTVELTRPQLNLILNEQGSNLQTTLNEMTQGETASAGEAFPLRVIVRDGQMRVLSPAGGSLASAPPRTALVTGIQGSFSTLNLNNALPELQLQAFFHQEDTDLLSMAGPAESGRLRSPPAAAKRTSPRLAANLDELTSDFSMAPLPSPEPPATSADSSQQPEASGSRLMVSISEGSESDGGQAVRIAARELDLRLLQPVLSAYLPDLLCDGMASCDVQAALPGRRISDGLVGRFLMSGQDVRLRRTGWAAGEWLALGPAEASGAVAIAADGLLLKDVRLMSDVLTLSGNGEMRYGANPSGAALTVGEERFPLPDAAATPTPSSGARGPENSAELLGTINVAHVARMLHNTLSMREDVQIQSGQLRIAVRGEMIAEPAEAAAKGSADDGRAATRTSTSGQVARWQASIQNDRIEALRAGQPVVLDANLRVDAVGPIRHGIPELAHLRVTGGFGGVEVRPLHQAYEIVGRVQPDQVWQQVQQFIDVPRPGIRGELILQARLALHEDHVTLMDLQLNSSDLKISSGHLSCYHRQPLPSMLEGALHLEGSGAAVRTLVAPWHTATWLAPRSGVVLDLTAQPQQMVHLRAQIRPSSMAAAVGTRVLSVSRAAPSAERFRDAAAAAESSSIHIDEATLDVLLQPAAQGSSLEIQNGRIVLPGLAAVVRGTVTTVADGRPDRSHPGTAGVAVVNLTADTEYDLNVLCSRLLPADSGFRLNGRGRSTWHVSGAPSMLTSLPPRRAGLPTASERQPSVDISPLQADGSLTWDSGELWGLQLGGTTVPITLENGIIRTEPVQCTLSGGDMHVMPQYHLLTERLQLATGSRVENLRITPDLCGTWLGYVAPLLANSASVTGQLSARVERFDYSFQQPESSDLAGTISILHAEATPGSGLLSLLESIDLVRRAGSADRSSVVRSVVLPKQEIPVEVRQGFIVHQGLLIELSGYRAQTSGGVGFNRQLQLALDVPLEKAGEGNDFRSLRIPIGGTIDAPQPDTAGLLQNLGTQSIERRLNKTLDQQLNKLLDRF